MSDNGNGNAREMPNMRPSATRFGRPMPSVWHPSGADKWVIGIRARRWLERQHAQLWANFHLSDDQSFENAVDWLAEQVIGVLEADRDETRARKEASAAGRDYDRRVDLFNDGRESRPDRD